MNFLSEIGNFFVQNIPFFIRLGISVVIFFAFFGLRFLFAKALYPLLKKIVSKTKTQVDDIFIEAFNRPIRALIIILGIFFALINLPLSESLLQVIVTCLRISFVVIIAWGLMNSMSTTSILFQFLGNKLHYDFEETLIRFLSKIAKGIIGVFAVLIIIGEVGYDVTGLITGLGLGGLTIALAAKDAAANFFGGIIIITDKPFVVGDWIQTPEIEGIVEDISFRSTRIRRFENSVEVVPNSIIANESIINWSKMEKRRITFSIGLTYQTSRQTLERITQRLREYLSNHTEINQDTIVVRFSSFQESSLEIYLYFFTNTTDFIEYHRIKEEVNFAILDIVREEGGEFAFDTKSIYLENPEDLPERVFDTPPEDRAKTACSAQDISNGTNSQSRG